MQHSVLHIFLNFTHLPKNRHMCVHITKTYLEARLPSAKNSQNLDKILKIDYNVINFEMLFLCPFTIFIYRGL